MIYVIYIFHDIYYMYMHNMLYDSTARQFDLEEMGWLLNYLTSVGMGIGKQGLFLMEVIELIKRLF